MKKVPSSIGDSTIIIFKHADNVKIEYAEDGTPKSVECDIVIENMPVLEE